MSYIYGIFLGDSDICIYIGSSSRDDINKRWSEHRKSLSKGKHSNKSLQKIYDSCDDGEKDFTYKTLYCINTSNTLIKFFSECLANSIYKPRTNKCLIAQGRMRVIMQRCESGLAKILLEDICKYYKNMV